MKRKQIQFFGAILSMLIVSSQLSAALLITVNSNTEMLTITGGDTGIGTLLAWETGSNGASGSSLDVSSGFSTGVLDVDSAVLSVASTGVYLSIGNAVSLTELSGTGVSISYASALTVDQKTFLQGVNSLGLSAGIGLGTGWQGVGVAQTAAVPEAETMGISLGAILLGFITIRRRMRS